MPSSREWLRGSACRVALVLLTVPIAFSLEGPPPAPEPPRFDVAAMIHTVQHAFRADGDGWEGGSETYSARVSDEGVAFTPLHGATVKLSRARMTRGGVDLPLTPAQGRVEADGSLSLSREQVVEHLRNRPEGLEQQWSFTTAPPGVGELVVQLPVDARFAATTGNGLRMEEARGGLGIRDGHATWVDARGERTPIPANFEAGTVTLRVPSKVIEQSTWPASLTPVISPEIEVEPPTFGAARDGQQRPAIASDGDNYLLVWLDSRSRRYEDMIFAARVSAAGQLLDPGGIILARAQTNPGLPSVAFDGTNYFVTWSGLKWPSDSSFQEGLFGVRVTTSGQVLDTTVLTLATRPYNTASMPTKIASDGENLLIAWEGTSSISTLRVSPDGAPAGPLTRIDIGHDPSLIFDGENYLLVWEGSGIYGARITRQGVSLGSFEIASFRNAPANPAVSFDGVNFLVVWDENDPNTGHEPRNIMGARVTRQGTVLDRITICDEDWKQNEPEVVFDGTQHFVFWSDWRHWSRTFEYALYGARVTPDGTVREPWGLRLESSLRSEPVPGGAASNGKEALVTWQASTSSPGGWINITRMSPTSARLGTLTPASAANTQGEPAIASSGRGYLLVWTDFGWNGRDSNIRGTFLSASGEILTPSGFVIARDADEQTHPSVAFDGENYFVVWEQRSSFSRDIRIRGAQVAPWEASGRVGSAKLIHQGSDEFMAPRVTCSALVCLVVWRNDSSFNEVMGARVSRTGQVLDPQGLRLATAPNLDGLISLASDGSRFLVVWEQSPFGSSRNDVMATLVDSDGSVRSPSPIDVAQQAQSEQWPQVAFNGTDYVVTWVHDKRVHGARVSADGAVLDPTPLAISPPSHSVSTSPSITFDGVTTFVTWGLSRGAGEDALQGADVRPSGVVEQAPPMSTPGGERALAQALAAAGPRHFMLAYERFTAPPYSTERIHGRTLIDNQRPVATSQSAQLPEDTPLALTLLASDPDQDALTFTLVTPPRHGTLSGTGAQLTYTPESGFHGADSFSYRASDVSMTSEAATVSLTITSVEDVPTAQSLEVRIPQNGQDTITLAGQDGDGDALTFELLTSPAHGTLSGTPPNLSYIPARRFHGTDAFTYRVSDGKAASPAATVSITVWERARPPTATSDFASVDEDTPLAVTLRGLDPDDDSLTFAVVEPPQHGTLSGVAPNLTYTPKADFHGTDLLRFTVNDGRFISAPATVALTVSPVNDAPVARSSAVTVTQGGSVEVRLDGSDVDDKTLVFKVTQPPRFGTLSGTPPVLIYTPAPNAPRMDSLTFSVSDGAQTATASVSVSITVQVNASPVTREQRLTVKAGEKIDFELDAVDPEGQTLTFLLTSHPATGTLSGFPPRLSYQAPATFNGEVSFTYRTSDGSTSTTGVVRIQVTTPATEQPRPEEPRPSEGRERGRGCSAAPGSSAPVLLGLIALLAVRGLRRARVRRAS
ncbi:Ig-like domain-containing protein [Myxococcus landrumensis]|uniref:Tandem-95 repeat protein n=1 Tax=Myxococcus landrumensis TaxID=2813577 RepID=A0ABX7N8W3_9BACT|nr:Ig-like domain-containing protein [Myxococcus landrumus]QSQ15212.1 tandem-95 repeat protein [Myxococcus landrumus]